MSRRLWTSLVTTLAALALTAATAAAQVAMPDAAKMSGVPLPAPELPNAAVTVRVVRERMGNNLPDQQVTLVTPDGPVTGVTDGQGRAQFMAVPAGSRVTAEVVVDGETIRSQEFTVPAAGGVRVALVAGVAKAAAADAAAKAEAAKAPARPGSVVFGADTRVILEFQDDRPTMFYLFSVVNNARTPIDTGHPLVLDLPDAAEGASLVSGPATIARLQDRRLTLTGPFPPGPTAFQVAYRLPLTSTMRIDQAWPAAVEGALVAVEKIGALTLTSPQLTASREGESNGQVFVMGTAGRLAEGQPLILEFSGLPAPPTWPRDVALTLAALFALWAAWAVWRGAPEAQVARDALVKERERLLGAIAAIDAERRARGEDARAAAKRERLVAAAEQVYAELDRLPRRFWYGGVTADFDRVAAVRVGRHYGRRRALNDISFTAAAGDIVGLLGPNGAGKSTLLAILATLLAPSTGRIDYGAESAPSADRAWVRARIGMLGHDLFLYPELTALENLVFFGRLYGVPDAPDRAAQALERAGLAARADDVVSSLSRGMRQRVALERALLHEPRLLLLDEPFTGLDQTSAAALVARLRDQQRRGVVTVLATHDLDVVDGLLTATLFLSGGRQVESGGDGGPLRDRYREAMLSP